MGNSNSKFLTNTAIIALVMIAIVGYAMSGKSTLRLSSPFAKAMKPYSGKTKFTKWEENNLGQPSYSNDYQPANTYASNDTPDDVDYGAMVNSTTFIDGKDKKAKAAKAKLKKAILARAAAAGSGRNNKLSAGSDNTYSSGGSVGSINALAQQKAQEKEKEENLNTVEYWEAPIFEHMDPNAVLKLIDSYQVQKVSSGVFYELVTEMTQDSRDNVREFGLLSLQATPSAKSFSYLAVIKHTDPEAELRNIANHEVNSYSEVNRLGFAIASISSTNVTDPAKVNLEAIKVVALATKNYVELSESGVDPTRNTASTVGLQEKLTKAYTALEIAAQSDDATIKSEAEKTMESISKVITI